MGNTNDFLEELCSEIIVSASDASSSPISIPKSKNVLKTGSVEEIYQNVSNYGLKAFESCDYECLDMIGRYFRNFSRIAELAATFERSPRKAVEGENGVTSYLGISKTAVQKRISALGLTPRDFRRSASDLYSLIQSSGVMNDLYREIEQRFVVNQDELVS
tara:strand:- start:357 stop:839 length:483 start_codon:yes stop_codon:yes gene_type:complete